jgi:curli biogenesis system outer membrane secretion channel CsgG
VKKLLIRTLWASLLILCTLCQTVMAADSGKKRVALFDFEFGTVHHWWGSWDWDIGKGIADMVVTNLVRDGTYSVIERKQLEKILQEQNFTNSDRANPATAAKIGKVLGVNAIVIGTITQFGMEEKKIGVGGFGSKLGALGRVGTSKGKANVVIDARMVDTETAEILAVASGKGESSRSGLDLSGMGGGAGGGIDMSASNFQETTIGEATRQAVDEVTRQLVSQAEKIQATTIEVKGVVADVNENSLVLNVGKNQGLNVGDVLAIERVVRQVKDPTTGEVIRTVTQAIGTAKITSVDARSSEAVFSGVGQPKVGDAVKPKK